MNRKTDRPPRLIAIPVLVVGTLLTLGADWRVDRVPELISRARTLAAPDGLFLFDENAWTPIGPTLRGRVVLLIHGLDEPGPIWDQLAPALADAGHTVIRFNYPNDQAIALSADELGAAIDRLASIGVTELDIVGHSMGGLVARDALTRPGMLTDSAPRVPRLITIGTPHRGAPLAPARIFAEWREHGQRWLDSDDLDLARLFGGAIDGDGLAARDLAPRSAFLNDLNTRPWATGTAVTSIIGIAAAVPTDTLDQLAEPAAAIGDLVVPADSAAMPGTTDIVLVRGNHRSIIRTPELEERVRDLAGAAERSEPPAIAVVLDRLGAGESR